jgi:hypothetical protein
MKACFGALETRIPAESSRFALQMRAFGPASHLGAGGTSRLLLLMILTFAARSANFCTDQYNRAVLYNLEERA